MSEDLVAEFHEDIDTETRCSTDTNIDEVFDTESSKEIVIDTSPDNEAD